MEGGEGRAGGARTHRVCASPTGCAPARPLALEAPPVWPNSSPQCARHAYPCSACPLAAAAAAPPSTPTAAAAAAPPSTTLNNHPPPATCTAPCGPPPRARRPRGTAGRGRPPASPAGRRGGRQEEDTISRVQQRRCRYGSPSSFSCRAGGGGSTCSPHQPAGSSSSSSSSSGLNSSPPQPGATARAGQRRRGRGAPARPPDVRPRSVQEQ